jgi:predicted  nucleic acid-binding Zn-ribbon protein
MTRNEVEEIKGHFDKLTLELRGEITETRREAAATAQDLRSEIAEARRHTGVVAEDLRSEIRTVGDGVALANERIDQLDLRVDGLTSEVRRGFAGVRAEIHRLHETDDELRRRIEAQERSGA